ncbi:MAG: HAD hydrolase-like protein [Elainellaceae cyanobacterium]
MQGLTIFCDFDGPIIDVSDRYYGTYRLSLSKIERRYKRQRRSLPITPLTKEQFWSFKQCKVSDVEIALRSGLPRDVIDSFLDCVKTMVNHTDLLHKDRLQPKVKWALNWLHSEGVPLVLVTLRCQSQTEEILRANNLFHLFTNVYGTQNEDAAYLNVTEWKAGLLQKAWHNHLCEYGRPLQSWMIGDTEADVLAGQTVGMPTIAVTSGIRSESYLSRFEPTVSCADFFSAACHILHQTLWKPNSAQYDASLSSCSSA